MRLRCPRCSTVVEGHPGGVALCSACGFSATVPGAPRTTEAPAARPPAALPSPTPSAPPLVMGTGPPGKPRSVTGLVVASILTFGAYTMWAYARATREMDSFIGRARDGASRTTLGAGLYTLGLLFVLGTFGWALASGIRSLSRADLGTATVVLLGAALSIGAAMWFAGFALVAVGMWCTWRWMEQADVGRHARQGADARAPNPFSATVALVLYLLMLLPSAGSVCFFVGTGITQHALNRIWRAQHGR